MVSPRRAEVAVLLKLAVPSVLTQLLTMSMGIVDTLMVSRLGTDALASATLGAVWVFGTLILAMGVLFGLDPIVSQAHGAGDGERAGLALQRGILLSLALSLPVAALWLVTGPVLTLLGQEPRLAAVAHGYAVVQIPSIPFFLIFTALRQYLAGRAIMAPAMWIMGVANLINVVLNWALIFGHLGAEPRGVVGAGLASGLSRIVQLLLLAGVVLVWRMHEGAWCRWSRRCLDGRGLWEILRFGLPVGAQLGLEVWGFHAVTFLAGRLGATALAAHAIVLNLASLTFMVPFGISIAAATRVGNLTGAGDTAGRRRAAWLSLALGAGVMLGSAALFLLFRRELPLLWRPEAEVLGLAALILPIAAAFQVFDGTQVVGCGVLRGVGDTKPAAWFNLIGYYGLALPLGAWFAFGLDWGLSGLWWGLAAGLLVVACLLTRRIARRV